MIGSYLHGHVNAVSLRRVERVDHNTGSLPDSVHEPLGVESGNIRASACRDNHVAPPFGLEFAVEVTLSFKATIAWPALGYRRMGGGRGGGLLAAGVMPASLEWPFSWLGVTAFG